MYHPMLNDTPNVMTELAPKGPRFVEIIEIMDQPDIPFIIHLELLFTQEPVKMVTVHSHKND